MMPMFKYILGQVAHTAQGQGQETVISTRIATDSAFEV